MPQDVEAAEGAVPGGMSGSENEYNDGSQFKSEDETMADSSIPESDVHGEVKKKYDPKDPMRPRRKKARRACYACQRAHLTCGDERPCGRCIKRGLADQCQDGVRKKAKYLHDAPPEALGPVLGPGYNNPGVANTRPSSHRHPSSSGSEPSSAVSQYFFTSAQPPIPTMAETMISRPPLEPVFQSPTNPQMRSMSVPQASAETGSFASVPFDPSNPALFNFNLDGLTFGSQYSAMELHMLNHMSSGAADTPPRDQSISTQGAGDFGYGSAGVFGSGINQYEKVYEPGVMQDFYSLDNGGNGAYSQGNLQHGLPHAYAIAARPTSLQSPSTENNSPQATPTNFGFEGSPTTATYSSTPGSSTQLHSAAPHPPPSRPTGAKPKSSTAPKFGTQSLLGKRQRDPSYIYESVKEPYQYVKSFHKLIAFMQNRYPSTKTLSIAKSLASIRPSFISCMGTLNTPDLVFMEKTFQRALFEYEDFMHQCSSPAIACRRTGEVAGVNKEFTALTGWTKEVLLGYEPNNNVNTGISSSASNSGSTGRAGQTTPRIKTQNETQKAADDKPQPVFLAELMDDDSVVTFYNDFAQLAFNNSRGTVMRKGRLLKYRTQENVDGLTGEDTPDDVPQRGLKQSILSNRVARIDGEHGISRLEKDGKLECSYTWVIKRDTFDIPMLIVVNFLPCYYRNHNQLAV